MKIMKHMPTFVWEFRYTVLPPIKVRLRYYYWIVRYGGKKRIPKEVVFGAMAKSLQRMNDNLDKAAHASAEAPDVPAETLHITLEALRQGQKLSDAVSKFEEQS